MAAGAPSAGPRIGSPTVVVGLGEAGRSLAAALSAEGGHADPNLRCLTWVPSQAVDDLRRSTEAAFESLLSLEHSIAAGRPGQFAEIPIDLFIVAQLGEAAPQTDPANSELLPSGSHQPLAASGFEEALNALDAAYERYAAVLGRDRPHSRLFASPILLLPDMDRAQPEIVTLLAGLAPRFTGGALTPPRLPLARCYLVEPRAGHYLLSDANRLLMTRSYLRFLLYGSLRTDDAYYRRAYEPLGDPDPFGSFVVGCAEFPGGALADLAAIDAGLLAMCALEEPSAEPPGPELVRYGGSEWLNTLPQNVPPPDARAKVDGAIERCLRGLEQTLAPTRLLERPRRVRERISDAWANERRAAFAKVTQDDVTVRPVLKGVVDDMARHGAEAAQDYASELDQLLRARLVEDNAFHHLDADAFLREVEGAISQRREQARAKSEATPDPGPDAPRLTSAVDALHREVERKPDPVLMALAGTLLTTLLVAVGSGIVPVIAGVFERPGSSRPGWLTVLREAPGYYVVGALLAVAGIGSFLAFRLWTQTRAINRQIGDDARADDSVENTLRALTRGGDHSAKAWFDSRYAITQAHWHARVLTDLATRVNAARDRFKRATEAVRLHRARLEREKHAAAKRLTTELPDGPVLRPVISAADLGRLSAGAAHEAVGAEPVRAVKRVLRPYTGPADALDFATLDALTEQAKAKAAVHSLESVLCSPDLSGYATTQIWRLLDEIDSVRRLGGVQATGTRLQLPLQLANVQADPGGTVGGQAPRLFASERVLNRLREEVIRAPSDEPARSSRREALLADAKPFFDPDRVYLLQVVWGINAQSIPWLSEAWPEPADADGGAKVLDFARERLPKEQS